MKPSSVVLPPWLWAATLGAIGLSCSGTPAPPAPSCRPPTRPPVVAPPPDVPCPTAAELDLVDREVPVTFEGASAIGALVCRAIDGSRDLTDVQKDVYQALVLMKSLTFDAPLPWTSFALYDWFKFSVAGVRIRTDIANDGCCMPARVISLRAVTSNTAATRWSALETMVHEARHAGGTQHTCGTNDKTIAELGSYGVQYYTMLWIGSHWPAASQAERDFALNRAALLRASGAFCQECE